MERRRSAPHLNRWRVALFGTIGLLTGCVVSAPLRHPSPRPAQRVRVASASPFRLREAQAPTTVAECEVLAVEGRVRATAADTLWLTGIAIRRAAPAVSDCPGLRYGYVVLGETVAPVIAERRVSAWRTAVAGLVAANVLGGLALIIAFETDR